MTAEVSVYLASSIVGALVGLWALASVIGDALVHSNRIEPRRTIARVNVRRIVLLIGVVALSLVLCIWVVFFPPLPSGLVRWLLVGMNVLVTLVLIFEQVGRREYERASE